MNTRQLYYMLFPSNNINDMSEWQTLPDYFIKLKNRDTFRSILRALTLSKVEDLLYGNHTDGLALDIYFSSQDFAKNFEKINSQYNYLTYNDSNIELFRRLYYICEIMRMQEENVSIDPSLCAYSLMVYFGRDNDTEQLLTHFEFYCKANHLSQKMLSIFQPNLSKQFSPIQLLAWQNLIITSQSLTAITLFQMAYEIEKFIGGIPKNLDEANIPFEILVRDKEWNHQELLHILSHAHSDQDQLRFILSLNNKNMQVLIQNHQDFCQVFSLLKNQHTQIKLLERLDDHFIKSFVKNETHCIEMLNAIHANNISLLIKKISMELLLKEISSTYQLLNFIEKKLPSSCDKSVFLINDMGVKYIKPYILDPLNINKLLQHVDFLNRSYFLLNIVGQKTCSEFARSGYVLCMILEELPEEDRYPFIKKVLNRDDLKNIHLDRRRWKEVKSKLRSNEEKLALESSVYSHEDLIAKSTLKNIKQIIQKTNWNIGWFRTVMCTKKLGRCEITAPIQNPVLKQIDEFKAVKAGRKSPTGALREIKKIGQETAKTYKTWTTSSSNLLFGKNETQKYFNCFDTEETFEMAFGLKKR